MSGRTVGLWILGCAVLMSVGCGSAPGYRGKAAGGIVQTVSVFYGTDRILESAEPGKVAFGWQRAYIEDDSCALGVCKVTIRRDRNHNKVRKLPTSPHELVNVASTTTLSRVTFYERIREKMWYANANETFVFVHGYNNTFEDAVKRTAELWYDIGIKGPPVMFSWPSRGGQFFRGVFGYFADSETIKWSVNHLRRFLVDLVDETSAEKLYAKEPARIHLIAHSMGGRVLSRALMEIADDLERHDPPIFCDVILAAPDIDRDLFRDVIVLKLLRSRLAEHYTLYVSSADNVIKTSQKLQFYPRVGNADDGLVAIRHDDFDTIDASDVQSGWLSLNHDYFITEPRVIRDLIAVLRHGNRDPGSPGRMMKQRKSRPGEPWVLRSNDGAPDSVLVSHPCE